MEEKIIQPYDTDLFRLSHRESVCAFGSLLLRGRVGDMEKSHSQGRYPSPFESAFVL